MIGLLIEKGHAYVAEGHVLFSVATMPAYGRLSGRSMEDMIAGARVEVAPYKRDPADFVLWKPSDGDQPGWDNPFATVRAPWLAYRMLCDGASLSGETFDIHAGGIDLVFPHHENEIAQSCCTHDTDIMAKYWLHNGFVTMGDEKMSKSLGNLGWPVTLSGRIAVRPSCGFLAAHYRALVALLTAHCGSTQCP